LNLGPTDYESAAL